MQGDLLLLGPDQQLAIGKVPEVEAEEVEPVVDVDDAGLGLAQLQPAAGEELGQARDDVAFEHLPRGGGDHEVVGIPDEVDASVAPPPQAGGDLAAVGALGAEQTLHAVERDVGEQGRDDAALRRAHRRRVQRAELDHAGFEPASDRGGEHRQTREQRRVIDAIEALGDVGIEDPLAAARLGQRPVEGLDRVHGAPSWPEAVAVRLEARLPFRLQRQLDERLHHPIQHGRYAQGPLLAVALRDVDPADRLGAVALEAQAFPKHRETSRRHVAHHAVDPRCSLAAIDLGRLADRQQLRGTRPNEELLQVLDLRRLAVLAGPKDPLLQPAYVALDRRPVDAGPALKSATPCRRFGADHRLTSRQVRQGRGIAFGDTRRKSAPFRDGHRPIRPITGRPSLSPASSTPWPVPLPRGRDTALAGRGPWGLPS